MIPIKSRLARSLSFQLAVDRDPGLLQKAARRTKVPDQKRFSEPKRIVIHLTFWESAGPRKREAMQRGSARN